MGALKDSEASLSAVFLSDETDELNAGADFLQRLTPEEISRLRAAGVPRKLAAGEQLFRQGDTHGGIWLIESGTVRTFYVSPAGREITLALWTPGHFVGGPEVFGGGSHVWSADVHDDAEVLYLTGAKIRSLAETMPRFAICLIEGLVAKGKCYSALVQMLGTRSVTERLAQLLIIFADTSSRREGNRLVIERKLTHDQLAAIVGATRQWVTMTLDKFQKRGLISVSRQCIVVENYDLLSAEVRG
ncbi:MULTISPECIES: Crp/Fnr family transcriptional regulator [unclassified Xanthobacter]|uniref:Crp/Fnr family transcriptional regulator n=1 Tax=unclassified Xanthobacter TaxID=2623496 RepID=UPI001F41AEFD|nr:MULTISPECIES: Crp/Fnr family transcriptional regulator [unclassified Xanthobacter]